MADLFLSYAREERDARQPFGFRQLQAADLSDWDGGSAHDEFGRLVASIASIVPPAPTVHAVPARPPAPTQDPTSTGPRPMNTRFLPGLHHEYRLETMAP